MSMRKLAEALANLTRPTTKERVMAPHKPVEELTPLTGPIVIRAWWNKDDEVWEAVEGSHRLAIAARDKLQIEIVPVDLDDAFPNRNPDGTDVIGWDPAIQVTSVRDALQVFKDYGKRPVYILDVRIED
jgi:hypothetical protein